MNFKSLEKIPSYQGSIVSIICFLVVAVYAAQRLQTVIFREKPDVAITIENGVYGASDTLDLNKDGFKIAFGAIDYKTG